MLKRMASIGSGSAIGKCFRSYASINVTSTSRRSPSGVPFPADMRPSISFNAARWSAFVLMGFISILSSSNCLCIDPVVLRMSADEPYVNHAIRIVDPHYQPIPVASDIEHRPAVAQDAGGAKVPLDVARRTPIRPEHMSVPGEYRLPSIGIRGLSAPETPQRGKGNNAHDQG